MLNGIRIIDFSNYLPGPFASMRLADLGAEVIKVEPLEGDPARVTGAKKNGTGLVYLANNRNKKSITLNLKEPEGKDIALQLISKADVVLESFRPGVMSKLGLGFHEAKEVNPNIVYCSITGYGNENKLGSHDLNYMAVSGVLAQLKDMNGRPVHPSITLADFYGGIAASEKILAGLVSRGKTGEGSYHCISIADVMVSLMGNHLLYEQATGYPSGVSVLNGEVVCYGLYETSDNRYVSLGALEKKFWTYFCLAVEREDLIEHHFSKTEESTSIYEEVKSLFKSKTLSEWIDFSMKVDCCLAPVLETNELKEFPMFMSHLFENGNGDRQVKMYSGFELPLSNLPPEKGEHSEEILTSILGASEDQLTQWKNKGIF
ncbi:CaiB/BaiF CoA-transferase family protein [Bacillus sp. 31A1R]|uniref:CaiB/BaiF CoA-transferase family protein n=1 Tax=Robertmurraya mangrovi TaxID=3098077 RepID=A0ABU5J0T3_9BACI|nr:CaiB/BaiF CoA-transferase family protein [Bacillus sp. 31A1R]MDZ5473014.1 CaiB/BaiF CoA-transferase family protein [Bacillus sp. 31A1R]